MKAISRTNNYSENYKIVDAKRNRINSKNGLALVEIDGKEYFSGAIVVEDNPITRKVLDSLTPKEQYEWLRSIMRPYVFDEYITKNNTKYDD